MEKAELKQALYDNWKTTKSRNRVSFPAFKEIMELIENRPRVTQNFILTEAANLYDWATDELSPDNENSYVENWADKLQGILKRAHVEVEGTTATDCKPRVQPPQTVQGKKT